MAIGPHCQFHEEISMYPGSVDETFVIGIDMRRSGAFIDGLRLTK